MAVAVLPLAPFATSPAAGECDPGVCAHAVANAAAVMALLLAFAPFAAATSLAASTVTALLLAPFKIELLLPPLSASPTDSIVLLLPVAPLATACRARERADGVAVTVAVLPLAPFATSPAAGKCATGAVVVSVMVLPFVLLVSMSSTVSAATVLLLPVAPLATACRARARAD